MISSLLLLQLPTSIDIVSVGGLNSTITLRHQCITAMKEYEKKSLEVSQHVLRLAYLVCCLMEVFGAVVSVFYAPSCKNNFQYLQSSQEGGISK